jgi:hypothetical protein
MQRTKTMTILSALAVAAVMVMPLDSAHAASKEKVLHNFNNDSKDGYVVTAPLVFDAAGNLYGTTANGGQGQCTNGFVVGCGIVFKLIPGGNGKWTEKVLYSFKNDGTDGNYPSGGLVFDTAGNLYGVTLGGGSSHSASCALNGNVLGCGTVFELIPGTNGRWTEKVLHNFTFAVTDGFFPQGTLVLDKAGNIYGTTIEGGVNPCANGLGCGVIFELSRSAQGKWGEKILHSFNDSTDGSNPQAGLVFGKAGNLYGTAMGGPYQTGTVFEFRRGSKGRWTLQVLHAFGKNPLDGSNPQSALISDTAGDLYGTTVSGGTDGSCSSTGETCGTVFEVIPHAKGKWTEKVIHDFQNDGKDGVLSSAGLVLDSAGNLYGTTPLGGNFGFCTDFVVGCGVVFELMPGAKGKWTEKILHNFGNGTDGSEPKAGLTLDKADRLYGTTIFGGNATSCSGGGCGTVFEVVP